jgi:hypothetical protein
VAVWHVEYCVLVVVHVVVVVVLWHVGYWVLVVVHGTGTVRAEA